MSDEAPSPAEEASPSAEQATPSAPVPAAAPVPTRSSWAKVGRALALRGTRAQLMAGVLCALVGFALVVQVQQQRTDELARLPQDELVRILDEVTQRTGTLEEQATDLRAQRADLVSGSDTQRAAREAATQRAEVQGILAGQLPAEGPGVVLTIREPDRRIPAHALFNVLEELRNAGAEAVQLNDVRLTASSYVVDTETGVQVDGVLLTAPYRWIAIGDPDTIRPALNMPGGALAAIRGETGTTDLQARDRVVVSAVRQLDPPRFATPVPPDDAG